MADTYLELVGESDALANVRRMLTQDADYNPLHAAYSLATTAAALVNDDKTARTMLAFAMVALIKDLDRDVLDFKRHS